MFRWFLSVLVFIFCWFSWVVTVIAGGYYGIRKSVCRGRWVVTSAFEIDSPSGSSGGSFSRLSNVVRRAAGL